MGARGSLPLGEGWGGALKFNSIIENGEKPRLRDFYYLLGFVVVKPAVRIQTVGHILHVEQDGMGQLRLVDFITKTKIEALVSACFCLKRAVENAMPSLPDGRLEVDWIIAVAAGKDEFCVQSDDVLFVFAHFKFLSAQHVQRVPPIKTGRVFDAVDRGEF